MEEFWAKGGELSSLWESIILQLTNLSLELLAS